MIASNSVWAPGDATEPRKNATPGDEEEHSGSSSGETELQDASCKSSTSSSPRRPPIRAADLPDAHQVPRAALFFQDGIQSTITSSVLYRQAFSESFACTLLSCLALALAAKASLRSLPLAVFAFFNWS